MRKVSLFIAMSLDGYIADSKGGVDWLNGHGNYDENTDTYSEFAKTIDTILMGWNTYHQIVTELSPMEWVYNEFTTYVITHNEHTSSEKIRFVDINPVDLVKRLKEQNGKDIWVCGGANLVQQLVNEDLIDYYYITVIPTLLGSGIRLFENGKYEIKLRLLDTQSYNGMTDLIYTRR
ncbi:dihydrofolate reductase family protein [Evtepia gabavorous]|uniref:dihydrofolate reductase family protein n=1 Tax=Evtepia gabavorous TaxID=2211183 RepID=UPI003A8EF673